MSRVRKSQAINPLTKEIDLNPDVLAILRLYSSLQDQFFISNKEIWKDIGLSERSLFIIALIEMGLDRPGMLIEYFEVKPSTMTFELNKLADADLLTREISPKDRRVILLRLTSKGRAAHKRMNDAVNAFMLPRLSVLEPGELETFLRIGQKIAHPESAAPEQRKASIA
ncbi:MAG TPA: hypothetical protein VF489_03295 [Sphingobium sp.]